MERADLRRLSGLVVVMAICVDVASLTAVGSREVGLLHRDEEPSETGLSSYSPFEEYSNYAGTQDEESNGILKSLHRLSNYYNTHSVRLHTFRLLDKNEDQIVTVREYSERNPNVTKAVVSLLFDTFDTDGDGQLTEEELVDRGDFWDITEDCNVFAIQQCDGRLTYTIQLSEDGSEQEIMCHGLQAYLDCLFSEAAFCDFESNFLLALRNIGDTYKYTRLCGGLVLKELIHHGLSSDSSRKKRFANTVQDITDSPTLECASSKLTNCSTTLYHGLREEDGNFCNTLTQYSHCVTRAAHYCNDETLKRLKNSVKVLTDLHRSLEICDFQ